MERSEFLNLRATAVVFVARAVGANGANVAKSKPAPKTGVAVMAQSLQLLLILLIGVSLTACGDVSVGIGGGGAPAAPAPVDPVPTGDSPSLAVNGCTNTVIVNDFAYGACGSEMEVVSLTDLSRSLIAVAADDIAADAELGLLFTQSQTVLSVLSLADAAEPALLTTAATNFSAFSGLSAANGVLVVSGGASDSNTQIYTYTDSTLTLTTDGIPQLDSATGNPDVHLTATSDGATAFYSQDIGAVANFAIQSVAIDTSGEVQAIADDIVLTPGELDFDPAFSPANFPVESEFLNDQLFVAHFAAQGIEVIDIASDSELQPTIPLPFEPTNIATDGTLLFVVGLTNPTVEIVDPGTASVTGSLSSATALVQPVGVAASLTHVAIADRTEGLLIIAR